ncbi:acyl-CoA carboxylase subunit epsilon [Nocardioides sp.]|uniref:acyl-CoA carboxylase subunit epsilon n=1 Tax=Nocardioides sp. TaxID=35761 RepID=UPI002B27A1AF|nr:acyl-CoA carboxylase subunit epsilon [Nocardioides sp.]
MSDQPTPDEAAADTPQPPAAPLLRIVTPSTTPEEVAAIVAVFSALGGGDTPRPKPRPQWNAPARMARPAVSHGPGGWRTSALPR